MTKYKITREGCMPNCLKTSFNSYEQARSAIRKWIRKGDKQTWQGRNPAITHFGFSIEQM